MLPTHNAVPPPPSYGATLMESVTTKLIMFDKQYILEKASGSSHLLLLEGEDLRRVGEGGGGVFFTSWKIT